MKEYCPNCDTQLVPAAAFCHACGVELPTETERPPKSAKKKTRSRAGSSRASESRPRRRRRVRTRAATERASATERAPVTSVTRSARPLRTSVRSEIRADEDMPEEELWSDTFSAKGLINYWFAAIAVSIALPWVASRASAPEPALQLTGILLGAIWLALLGWIVVLKLDVYYTLTTQRLLHQSGILTRHTHRIEVIDIDDVSYRQGLLERFLGVGTLEIVSSDVTDPVFELPAIDHVHEVAEMIDEARRAERVRRGLHIEAI